MLAPRMTVLSTSKNAAAVSPGARSVMTSSLGRPSRGARAAYARGVSGSPAPAEVRITLVSKPGCHLCDQARATIEQVAAELGVGWVERSIEDDPALREQYWEQIPVTFVDGRQHDYWRVDATRLRSALTSTK